METLTASEFDRKHPNASFTPCRPNAVPAPTPIKKSEEKTGLIPKILAGAFVLTLTALWYLFVLGVIIVATVIGGLFGFLGSVGGYILLEILCRKSQKMAAEKESLEKRIAALES